MLLAFRLAGLPALEAHYSGLIALTQSNRAIAFHDLAIRPKLCNYEVVVVHFSLQGTLARESR
jgi:hypothetical protein